jgi:hypothetical protein
MLPCVLTSLRHKKEIANVTIMTKKPVKLGPDGFSPPIFIGKSWTLEVERSPTAIDGVLGYITDAVSAHTYEATVQPNGIDIGFYSDYFEEKQRARYPIPLYVQKRLFSMMRKAIKELRRKQSPARTKAKG